MTNSKLKTTLAAAAVALSFFATAAQAETATAPSRNTGVGQLIAVQGNVALRLIRAEAAAAFGLLKPALPTRSTKAAVRTAASGGAGNSLTAAARCAE